MLSISAFAIFFVMGAISLAMLDRVRVVLSLRHPEAFRALLRQTPPTFMKPMASIVSGFIWRRGDRGLGDASLTRLVILSQGLHAALMLGGLAWIVFKVCGATYRLYMFGPN